MAGDESDFLDADASSGNADEPVASADAGATAAQAGAAAPGSSATAPLPPSPAATARPSMWRRLPAPAVPVLLVLAGMVLGGVIVSVWPSSHHHDKARPAAFRVDGRYQAPFGGPGGGPGGAGGPGGGPGFGGGGPGSGRGFGFGFGAIQGTIATVGASSVTVRADNGTTTTYQVDANSQLLKNGQPIALSALKAGDAVRMRVAQLNGQMVVLRLIDGTPSTPS